LLRSECGIEDAEADAVDTAPASALNSKRRRNPSNVFLSSKKDSAKATAACNPTLLETSAAGDRHADFLLPRSSEAAGVLETPRSHRLEKTARPGS
jgi:hypothetical protein